MDQNTWLGLIVLAAVLHTGESCSGAADKKSLQTLKRFLGIDYVDRLLYGRNTSYSETDYISRPSDLNCDFEQPALCQWSNYRSGGTDPRDNVDWFLFRQSNAKKWPASFTPGTQPPQGNQFILAGDKSPKPSSAVFYSSPIRCQQSGELSFNYLLYSIAKVVVVAVKPGTDPIELIPGVKPTNCPKFARPKKRGDPVRCVVNFPKIDQPFQLAIRAHSLRNSLSVVDDIIYTGDICGDDNNDGGGNSGGADSNTDFESILGSSGRDHRSGLRGTLLRRANEADCRDFGTRCRWGLASGSSNDGWQVFTGLPDRNEWRRVTGTPTMPTRPYLALVSNGENGDLSRASFVTDPIACQRNDATVKLRYWLTEGAELEVCAVSTATLSKFQCQRLTQSGSPGPTTVQLDGPIDEEFILSIEGVVPPDGGFVAIDDVNYDADICPTAQEPDTGDVGDIFNGLNKAPLSGGLTGENIEFEEDLGCDFAPESVGRRDEFKCQWGNAGSGRGGEEFQIIRGEVDPDLLEETTGSPVTPDGEFAGVEFGRTGGVASLQSDPVTCQEETVDPNLLEETTGSPVTPDGEFAGVEFGRTGGVASLQSDPVTCQEETVDPNLLEETTGSPVTPDGEFAGVEFGRTGGVASLQSDPVTCQEETGEIEVSYWLSDGVELRACAVDARTGRRLHSVCPVLRRGPASAQRQSVRFPHSPNGPIKRPFKVELEATSSGQGFAMLDDIEYVGELCGGGGGGGGPPPGPDPAIRQACNTLKCTVDGGGLCNFRSMSMRTGDPRFQVFDRAIGNAGNIRVGRRYPEPFLGASIERQRRLTGQASTGGEVAVLRSQNFRLPTGSQATLRFKHQRSTVGSQLWFCHNTFNRDLARVPLSRQRSCFRVSGGDDFSEIRSVTTAAVPITSRTQRIILVAYHPTLRRNGDASFLIDDLTLTTPDGNELC